MSDVDLVRKARDGDETAYHEMVDRYADDLYRLAFSLVGNAADAEDVLQETFLGAFRHVRKFQERASVRTWLSRILVKQAGRCHRARARHKTVSLHGLPDTSQGLVTHGAASGEPDTRMDLVAMLDGLSPMHREVIVLREFQAMSYEEMSDVLAVPRGTVESRLFRARQVLKERLRDYLS